MTPGQADAIPAVLVLAPDLDGERSVPVYDRLVVGRECAGVDERQRLLIDDPAVSRTHLELRLDLGLDQAWLTDHSTNGIRLNGQRMERSVPVRIKPGDRVRLGRAELPFRSRRFGGPAEGGDPAAARELRTIKEVTVAEMAMVAGDLVGFSTIAETIADRVLLENIDRLYAELRQILARHHGTLTNYVGDAFFAAWEAAAPDGAPGGAGEAARSAVQFAVEAAETVPRVEGVELGPRQFGQYRGRHRADQGRAGAAVEERKLPDHAARADRGDPPVCAPAAIRQNFQLSLQDEIQRLVPRPGGHHGVAGTEPAVAGMFKHRRPLPLRGVRQQLIGGTRRGGRFVWVIEERHRAISRPCEAILS